jgi:endoglucanase
VVFDLFNEPYPEKAGNGDEAGDWQCWLGGGTCAGLGYPVAGMQSLVNAVRGTGASNVLMLGGLEWANDLTGWLMSWLDSELASYLARAWDTDFNCATGPGLMTSHDGTPTVYGAGFESHISALAGG